ncbi:MAG: RNA polymerase sigma factor [Marinilabiliaceae bacterium]|jgi:RNA polymerase sigma-70 factor (ECF subfamily)|nr:RNA polymerase sigma factor [Marinilabiliaceae bacterium]
MINDCINDDKFIKLLKKGDVNSYHQLYNIIAPCMRAVCLRYVKNKEDAEDVFQEAFIKVFNKIQTLNNNSLFLGWMKKIFVNTALDFCKNKKTYTNENIENITERKYIDNFNDDDEIVIKKGEINYKLIRQADFSENELLVVLNNIPEHFRNVFQLYAIDGFKHREIAEMLSINEKTSKTRLLRARAIIKKELQVIAEAKLKNG